MVPGLPSRRPCLLRSGSRTGAPPVPSSQQELEVRVENEGDSKSPPARTNGSGHGLIGMRERVAPTADTSTQAHSPMADM